MTTQTINKVESMVKQLNDIYTKDNKQVVVNYLADLFKEMGYTAISEEIRCNRRAKDNALYGLKMYQSSLTGDRINPDTREVYKVPEEHKNTVNTFCDLLKSVIDTYLNNGTDKQREYLKLKGNYENATYLFHESMFKLEQFYETATREEESINEHRKLKDEYNYLDKLAKEAKNKLDQFVLENI